MIRYDYSKLLGRMKERGYTQAALAKEIGISETSLNLRLNNKLRFSQDEILKSCDSLGVPRDSLGDYFFAVSLNKC